MKKLVFAVAAVAAMAGLAETDPQQEDLAKRQARSVHLLYRTEGELVAGKATVTVTETRPQTYFSILGWKQGYCGIQDLGDERVFIFSVWDPSNPEDLKADPNKVEERLRARIVYSHPYVNVSRFGGGGSGVKTLAGVNWKVGEPVTAKVECAPDGDDRIIFTCSVKSGDGEWEKIASISTMRDQQGGTDLGYLASFVEDFRRNYESAKESRGAVFSDIRFKTKGDNEWQRVSEAMFTADNTPSETIDAGPVAQGAFFLKTGGETVNAHAKLWSWIGK